MGYIADAGITTLIYISLAVSLNLLVGYTGRVSMAHAIFFGVGGFTAARLTLPTAAQLTQQFGENGVAGMQTGLGWNWFVALLVAALVAFAAALFISLPAVRLVHGEYLILLTLAFQLVGSQLMNIMDPVTGGPYGLSGIPPISFFGVTLAGPVPMFWVLLCGTIITILICWGLGQSPFGRLLKAIREHETAVESVGKDPVIPELLAFGISAALAGSIGALAVFYYGSAVPGNYTIDLSILMIAAVVLGGAGNITGTILGAVALGLLEPVLRQIVGDASIPWQAVIYGAALVLMMRLRPEGLLPERKGFTKLAARLRSSRELRPALPTPGEALERLSRVTVNNSEQLEMVVEVQDLKKSFGGLAAVNGATFGLQVGVVTALIGPNGAGKTTIFNMICGTDSVDSGRVFLMGEDVTGQPTHKLAKKGLVRSFQDIRVCQKLSALDNVAMAVPRQSGENVLQLIVYPHRVRREEARVRRRSLDCLALLDLADKAEVKVGDLSYGDQKLVAIARLIATDSDVLLLDEPTSGVDPVSVERVVDGIGRLRELGRTVCLVEHSVHFVQRLADRAVFLDQGSVIAEGTVAELMKRADLAELYFGV